ncbi:MAG: rRNA maturation RNase YbeY [Gammaproteobacteria bacterium]
MEPTVDIQYACDAAQPVPAEEDIRAWVDTALAGRRDSAQLTVRIVAAEESRQLNETYRRKQGPTNVLSFSFEEPELLQPPLLGDVVICAAIVASEAQAQGKAPDAHWAHMVIHGVLHLLGYDHENREDARLMEAEERKLLAALGYGDPYGDEDGLCREA